MHSIANKSVFYSRSYATQFDAQVETKTFKAFKKLAELEKISKKLKKKSYFEPNNLKKMKIRIKNNLNRIL